MRSNLLDLIGKTPLMRLRSSERSQGIVFAKLELLNPFGMKDRVAKRAILEARRRGVLADGAPIMESSSGTMALGLALVGTYLDHPVHIVSDPRIDPITLAKLHALNCTVHIVPCMTNHGWQGARLEKLQELMEHYPGAFWPRQYDNPDNPLAYSELAGELLAELGSIDVLVGPVGSGGSLCGTARELKRSNPQLYVVAVDATGSVIFGQPDCPTRLQSGLGNSLIPANVDLSIIDEVHWLNDEEAFAATCELASYEKIFAGNSSGSAYAVARWLSTQVPAETKIVVLFPDRGDRYYNTIYNQAYRLQKGIDGKVLPTSPREMPYTAIAECWSYSRIRQRSF